MFVIKPRTPEDMAYAMFLLSYYKVMFSSFSDGEHSNSTFIKVSREYRKGDLRLAEMAFQMAFYQEGMLCPVCKMKNEGKKKQRNSCGHLTFTGVIEGRF